MDYQNYDLEKNELLEKLDHLYEQNGYYDRHKVYLKSDGTIHEHTNRVKNLRISVNRSVEFYVSKLAVPITINHKNQNLVDAANLFLKNSNFLASLSPMLRKYSLHGNVFAKVVASEGKVYFEVIDNRNISAFKLNSRGFITEIRIDVPYIEDGMQWYYTEFWQKNDGYNGYFSTWNHQLGINADLERLGNPNVAEFLPVLGLDYCPFVQIKWKDIGYPLGVGCVAHVLDKLDEANKLSTSIDNHLLNPKIAITAPAVTNDGTGRSVPPRLGNNQKLKDNETQFIDLPNGQQATMIPMMEFDKALAVLQSLLDEIQEDCPELKYYSMKDQLSGRAIQLLLAGAIDRAKEAQGNFLQGLTRIIQIGLSLMNFWGLANNIGTYENGDFDFTLTVPQMFESSLGENATILKDLVASSMPLASSLKLLGFSDEKIAEILLDRQSEMDATNSSLGDALQPPLA
jgi:hypothetical protein